jgi:hypothetical protein
MRRVIGMAGLALVIALAAGCQREEAEALYAPSGKVFVFNYRHSYATYMLTFAKVADVPQGARVFAEFENPEGGAPLTLDRPLFPGQDKLVLESPHVSCVKKERPYKVKMAVLAPSGETLQSYETTVISTLDQSILPEKPMIVGPGYQMNPEVYKAGGKADYAGKANCPA